VIADNHTTDGTRGCKITQRFIARLVIGNRATCGDYQRPVVWQNSGQMRCHLKQGYAISLFQSTDREVVRYAVGSTINFPVVRSMERQLHQRFLTIGGASTNDWWCINIRQMARLYKTYLAVEVKFWTCSKTFLRLILLVRSPRMLAISRTVYVRLFSDFKSKSVVSVWVVTKLLA
jgi:hypothetical protein